MSKILYQLYLDVQWNDKWYQRRSVYYLTMWNWIFKGKNDRILNLYLHERKFRKEKIKTKKRTKVENREKYSWIFHRNITIHLSLHYPRHILSNRYVGLKDQEYWIIARKYDSNELRKTEHNYTEEKNQDIILHYFTNKLRSQNIFQI